MLVGQAAVTLQYTALNVVGSVVSSQPSILFIDLNHELLKLPPRISHDVVDHQGLRPCDREHIVRCQP